VNHHEKISRFLSFIREEEKNFKERKEFQRKKARSRPAPALLLFSHSHKAPAAYQDLLELRGLSWRQRGTHGCLGSEGGGKDLKEELFFLFLFFFFFFLSSDQFPPMRPATIFNPLDAIALTEDASVAPSTSGSNTVLVSLKISR